MAAIQIRTNVAYAGFNVAVSLPYSGELNESYIPTAQIENIWLNLKLLLN